MGWAGPVLALWLLGLAGFTMLRRTPILGDALRGVLPAMWIVAGVLAWLFAVGLPALGTVPVLGGFNLRGGWVLIPELVALLAALAIYTAAFIAEVVRAGIQSVPRGQVEAGRALGDPVAPVGVDFP